MSWIYTKVIFGNISKCSLCARNVLQHTTKFASLVDLAINLRCGHIKELRRCGNASYRSEQFIIFSISECTKQDILTEMRKSSTISIMADDPQICHIEAVSCVWMRNSRWEVGVPLFGYKRSC